MNEPEIATGLTQIVIEGGAVVRSRPDLVSKLAREAGAHDDGRRKTNRGLAELEKLERRCGEVLTNEALHELSRSGPSDRESAERRCGRADLHIGGRVRSPEPAQVKLLGETGAEDQKVVIVEAGNRQVSDDATRLVQHGRER